jgi:hypothetical protein
MDASQIIRYRQAHSQFNYYDSNKRGQQSGMNIKSGASSLIYKGHTLIQSGMSTPIIPIPCSVNDSIIAAMSLFLRWIATSNLGPTVTARYLYIWFMAASASWNWVQVQGNLAGTQDGWNWNTRTLLYSAQDIFVWMNHAMADTFGLFFTGHSATYSIQSILDQEAEMFGWTPVQQAVEVAKVRASGNWPGFWSAWSTWSTGRFADGSVAAATAQPTAVQVKNKNIQLETDNPTLPPFVDISGWTPLKLPMKPSKQGYLTFNWDNVRSTGIISETLDSVADAYYIEGADRISEINDVIQKTADLNDATKIQAEFWAGGPYTVTPPGMFAWFWKEYVRTTHFNTATVLFSGLELAIHLFEESRLVWRNKARKVQARPIQVIRILKHDVRIASWDGDISGSLWMPYQEANFVTPPFGDYPSGHSGFSQGFANTMSAWFGNSLPTYQTTKTDLDLLSPVFLGTTLRDGPFGSITFPARKSIIQTGVVPATPIPISWNTWQDIANSAGISRLYGGIHCLSAHTGSQAIANALHTQLNNLWRFNRNGN